MTRILTSDILTADLIAPLRDNPRLAELAGEYGLPRDGKKAINRRQLEILLSVVAATPQPGGSSANVMTGLSRLLGGDVKITFLGVAGEPYRDLIRRSLEEAGVTLLAPPETIPPEAAISVILIAADHSRAVATYPGNAGEMLDASLVTDALLERQDAVFLQGSLWERFDDGFVNALAEGARRHGKELWLALPTHAKFGAENTALFKSIIPQATLVLANIAELARVTGVIGEHVREDGIGGNRITEALERLKRSFHSPSQIGFITLGEDGAYLVTKDAVRPVSPPPAHGHRLYTLGAGDTAFAGFLAGYLKSLPPETAAGIGMALAGEKLKINAPRLPDPKAALTRAAPDLAARLSA